MTPIERRFARWLLVARRGEFFKEFYVDNPATFQADDEADLQRAREWVNFAERCERNGWIKRNGKKRRGDNSEIGYSFTKKGIEEFRILMVCEELLA